MSFPSIDTIVNKSPYATARMITMRLNTCIENFAYTEHKYTRPEHTELKFTNGAACDDNFMSKKILPEHTTIISQMYDENKNDFDTCQSYMHIFNMIYESAVDSTARQERYDDWDENKGLDELTSEILEDVAVFAFGGKNLSSHGDDGIKLYHKRERLLEILEPIARAQIDKHWPMFKKKVYHVPWYLFFASLIKRTYGINVFLGDGIDFALAYLSRADKGKGGLSFSDNVHVVFQQYNFHYPAPKGLKVYCINSNDHVQLIYYDGTCIVFSNNQNLMQATLLTDGPSPLFETFNAMCDPRGRMKLPSYDKIKNFSFVFSKDTPFSKTYEQCDFVLVRAPPGL